MRRIKAAVVAAVSVVPLVLTGTPAHADFYGYVCDEIFVYGTLAEGSINCVAQGGAPTSGLIIPEPFRIERRDDGFAADCDEVAANIAGQLVVSPELVVTGEYCSF